MRRRGLSYSEILKLVPVAQSTISVWCKGISLSNHQKAHLQKLKSEGVKRGARLRHTRTQSLKQLILTESSGAVGTITDRELWLIGVALYWGEGSKQHSKTMSQGVKFTNSDPSMIKLFDTWLTKIVKVKEENVTYEIYLHESMSREKSRIISFWSQILGKPAAKFDRIYLKRNIIAKSYPKSDYKGVVRIVVKKSTNLNRQISGWQQGIIHSCEIV